MHNGENPNVSGQRRENHFKLRELSRRSIRGEPLGVGVRRTDVGKKSEGSQMNERKRYSLAGAGAMKKKKRENYYRRQRSIKSEEEAIHEQKTGSKY